LIEFLCEGGELLGWEYGFEFLLEFWVGLEFMFDELEDCGLLCGIDLGVGGNSYDLLDFGGGEDGSVIELTNTMCLAILLRFVDFFAIEFIFLIFRFPMFNLFVIFFLRTILMLLSIICYHIDGLFLIDGDVCVHKTWFADGVVGFGLDILGALKN
jgi:hypothetical protein